MYEEHCYVSVKEEVEAKRDSNNVVSGDDHLIEEEVCYSSEDNKDSEEEVRCCRTDKRIPLSPFPYQVGFACDWDAPAGCLLKVYRLERHQVWDLDQTT